MLLKNNFKKTKIGKIIMARSCKDNILILGGIGAYAGIIYLTSDMTSYSMTPSPIGLVLGFFACIFVMFIDKWYSLAKKGIERQNDKKLASASTHQSSSIFNNQESVPIASNFTSGGIGSSKFCGKCGSILKDGDTFCHKCGTSI